MQLLVKTATKFMLVKPAENCTEDLLRIRDTATITKRKACPVSDHFNIYIYVSRCGFSQITPLEHVSLDTERERRNLD